MKTEKDYGALGCNWAIASVILVLALLPFRSKAQRRFLFAKHPRIAKRFAQHTKKGVRLPEHASKRKRKRKRTKKKAPRPRPSGY